MGDFWPRLRCVQTDAAITIGFWCPGCQREHSVPIRGPYAWSFNGDREAPTLAPSILVTGTQRITDDEYAAIMRGEKIVRRPFRCHSFLRGGEILYQSDCTHALAGQRVPLPDIPTDTLA